MAENTETRQVTKVAAEFNVSFRDLVDTLNKNGFALDAKPTLKITPDMYKVLLGVFGKDKELKQQAAAVVTAIPGARKDATVEIPATKEEEKVQPKAKEKAEEKPVEAPKAAEEKPAKKSSKKEAAAEEVVDKKKITKRGTSKIVGVKLVGKIELPVEETPAEASEKKKKKSEEKKAAGKKSTSKKKKDDDETLEAETEATVTPEPTEPDPIVPSGDTKSSEETKPVAPAGPSITTQYKQLAGIKVINKIDLPVKDKKPDYSEEIHGKKKRKRIIRGERINITEVGKGEDTRSAAEKQKDRPRPQHQTSQKRQPRVAPEITSKEIQDKIRETMTRLTGQTKGKRGKIKARRSKEEVASSQTSVDVNERKKLQVTEFVSVAELASLINVPVTEVIKTCMNLGVIVSINQRLDADVIQLVSDEFGFDVQFISLEEKEAQEVETEAEDPELLKPRAPIVTIMGHVDHGKTSLLDYIRSANVVAGEVGGITQHIGAYEVKLADGREITFLDTPGHEAFTAMRARGAKITDIAVIVIAADDSIMPQTREAISHAQAAGVPMVFAFNKMDKPGANAEKIREQLSQLNILVEEWGGKFQTQEISAKKGLNIDKLLDKILLEAEFLNLKSNPDKFATGSVIEATLDKGRGYVTTILVQEGTLHLGDVLLAGSFSGRVKAMQDERGQKKKVAGPATPVQVLGLDGAPQAGEKVRAMESEQEAKQIATERIRIMREQGIRTKKHITLDEIGRRLALGNFKELSVIVKADFDGSVEALTDSLQKLSTQEIQVNVVHKGVGQITESDILLAAASDAVVIGFQVRPSLSARKLAEKENIEIRLYSIIYDAIEELRSAMEGMLEPKIEEKIVCNIDVREVFKITKVGSVAGCYVTEGKITRQTKVRLIRDGIVVYSGELASLKRFKDDQKEVAHGMECGIAIKNFNDIKVGDVIEGYEEVEVKRTL